MDKSELMDIFGTETTTLIKELIGSVVGKRDDDGMDEFSLYIHRFVLEKRINLTKKEAFVETFYLTKDEKIYGQLNKAKVNDASVRISVDQNGQVKKSFGGKGRLVESEDELMDMLVGEYPIVLERFIEDWEKKN